MNTNYRRMLVCAVGALVPLLGLAGSLELRPTSDTFINSASPNANAGITAWFDAGTDGQSTPGVRRGLLRFDLSGLPTGSTVTSVVLTLKMTKVPGFGQAQDSTMALYRLNAAWGEGGKTGPNGAPASPGEATWNARLHGTTPWSAPGAASDATSTDSASTAVGSVINTTYNWTGAGMLEDVQAWVDDPAANFGWLMRSLAEGTSRTVRGFASREAGADAPRLVVGYTPGGGGGTNTTPEIAIIAPTNGASFTTPANVTVTAEASSPGSVTNVQFFNGTNLIGTVTTPPFTLQLDLFPGTYDVTAVAANNQGLTVTSSNVTFTVSSVAITNPIAERIPKADLTVELLTVADGLASPLGMAVPDDGSGRMFVYDQDGRVYLFVNGERLQTPVLDLSSRLVLLGAYDERGFLGLAAHPDFGQNPLLYTYTSEPVAGPADFQTGLATNNHQSVITEWRLSESTSNVVDVTSAREVLRIDQPQSNHNGGAMHFGPDGFLYVSLGDGGGANDVGSGHVPGGNAQSLDRIWGKLIRIDVAGTNSANGRYGIPASNPFVGTNGLDEIYAFGLRNPFTFSFDKQTGELYMPDVGQNRVEEINIINPGGNYGWNVREGGFWFDPAGAVVTAPVRPPPPNLIDPIAQYDHDDGLAVIGGFVYRGSAIPELSGRYVFGDWGAFGSPSGRLYYLDATNGVKEFRIGNEDRPLRQWIKGFGQDPQGELYVFTTRWLGPSGNTGRILKIVPVAPQANASLEVSGTNLSLSWSGGNGPIAVQQRASLSEGGWSPVTVTDQTSLSVPATGSSGFFRLFDTGTLPKVPLSAYLSGAAAGNTNTGTGLGLFALDGNSLSFNISYGGLSGAATGGHIHGPAGATNDAVVLISLAPYNGGSWSANGTISGVVLLTDAQRAHILTGKTYVNLHTDAFGGGEIRGQIVPVNFQVSMDTKPAGAPAAATGSANVTLVGNQLTFSSSYSDLSGTATAAHFHGPAGPGQSAAPFLDLAPYNGGAFGTSGAFSGTATVTPQQIGWLVDGLVYINVHTLANQGGEVRGQVWPTATAVPLTVHLSGLAERPVPLTNSGAGSGVFSLEGNTLRFNVSYSGLSGPATLAHIHGPANTGAAAPPMIDLAPYAVGTLGVSGAFVGAAELTPAQREAVVGGLTYVNVHTAANGAGEIRGQIASVLMSASLSGNNERPTAVATPGKGGGTFALIQDRLTSVIAYADLLSAATASHIHGPAGFTGSASVLVGLDALNGGSYGRSGALSGTVTLPVPALLNVIDGQTYVNFHTTNHTGGEIRGHLLR